MGLKMAAAIILALPLLAFIANAQPVTFDITNYGAKNNVDISKVLLKVWTEACASAKSSKIVIPKGTWQLSQVKLEGPNKSPIELKVQGTLKAPGGNLPKSGENWITINYVNNLEISGGGVFDGQGQQAWKKNDCHKNTKCEQLPLNLSFNFINNSIIHDVTSKDSKNFHINLISSKNITFSKLTISAPAESPNTDGLHLARSSNVYVTDSVIETGDDCISIGDESKEFYITNVKCGPGHGISIGSLGKYPGEKDVTGIYVKKCTFKNTEHGVRVKTWPSTPIKLVVSELHFEDLTMDNVTHPIIIDQEYCPWNQCKKDSPSLVSIKDVYIKEVRGTTNGVDPVVLSCSKSNPCQNVNIGNINFKSKGELISLSGDALTASIAKSTKGLVSICSNVKPILTGKQNIAICGALASLST